MSKRQIPKQRQHAPQPDHYLSGPDESPPSANQYPCSRATAIPPPALQGCEIVWVGSSERGTYAYRQLPHSEPPAHIRRCGHQAIFTFFTTPPRNPPL